MNQLSQLKRYLMIPLVGHLVCLTILTSSSWSFASQQEVKLSSASERQRGQIAGRVTDQSGEPLAGASIRIVGMQISASADSDGRFSLSVPAGEHVIEVSFISFATQRKSITVKDGESMLANFVLVSESNALNEVVVVGYGQQRKSNLTGAVDQVSAEVLQNRPISNISQGLVGMVPNLNIRMLDGKPTQSPSFNIRGTTSIGQGGSALILIDGVEGDPRMLNPNDIASISVLKDAASASIYGARAAFGVVLITTKSAADGKTSINYSTNFSLKSPTTVPDNITESYPWAQGFSDSWSRWNDNGNTPTAVNKTLLSLPPTWLKLNGDGKTLHCQEFRWIQQRMNSSITIVQTGIQSYIKTILFPQNIIFRYPEEMIKLHFI